MAAVTGHSSPDSQETSASPAGGLALLPLAIALAVTLALTIYPPMLTDASGKADHPAALLALWAMSSGYIRGVGFVPRNRGLRWVFSTSACVLTLAASIAKVAWHWVAP